jgi:hypothetical protein
MNRSVSEALRRLVSTRAENLCEYCLIDIADTFFGGEVDHLVSVKHSGATVAENLPTPASLAPETKGVISGRYIGRPVNWCGSLIHALIAGQTILHCMVRSSTR